MIEFSMQGNEGILIIQPHNRLSSLDFENLSRFVDKYLECNSHLKGIMIVSRKFPWWTSFFSFFSHVNFVKNHHKK
jgi:hypothetical protein